MKEGVKVYGGTVVGFVAEEEPKKEPATEKSPAEEKPKRSARK